MELLTRAPRRLSITISDVIFKKINVLADHEGRSTSNLCAYLLEAAVRDIPEPAQPKPAALHQGEAVTRPMRPL
jgi:hypothetical protein